MLRTRLQRGLAGWAEAVVLSLLMMAAGAANSAAQTQSPTAQQPPATPGTVQPAPNGSQKAGSQSSQEIHIRSNLVETPVTVTDSNGDLVYDLSKQDFQVFDNGHLQQIQSLAISNRQLAVVILIQADDSVKPLLKQLTPLVPIFSDLLLGPKGRAAVMSYSNRVKELQDFSNSGDALRSTFKHLTARGGQARLNDAMTRAIALLNRQPKTDRRILIVFSDGSDSGSETSERDVIARAARADVTVYALGFSRTQALFKSQPQSTVPDPANSNVARSMPPNSIHTPTEAENTYGTPGEGLSLLDAAGRLISSKVMRNHGPLATYASTTGGVFYHQWSERSLQDHLSRIADEIHSQYQLAYVPNDLNQAGFHRIEVRVARRGLKVRARAGYFYPWVTP